MRENVSEVIGKIIRWYDIAALVGIFILVTFVSAITGEMTINNLINMIAISLIVFGFTYVFIGLFGEIFFDFEQMPDKGILNSYK